MRRSQGTVGIGVGVFLALLWSCAPKHLATGPADDVLVVFPAPPEQPRIQFLTRISESRDVVPARTSSFWRRLVGETEEERSKPIIKPYGIAIHSGRIYVCDTMLGGLEVIDLRQRTFEYFRPRGPGRLKKPINCFVDEGDGRLYVADVDRGQVVVFDTAGRYVAGFGERETARPTDVFATDDRVWVCDIENAKIHVYDKSTYRHLSSFPDAETGAPGTLYSPTNLYVTGDRVYVSDFGDFRIKVFSREGAYLTSIGSYGRAHGQFVRPKGIAVDREANLYVVDAGFQNVQVFDPEGRLLLYFGGGYEGPGTMWLPAKVIIDYENLSFFEQYVHSSFDLKYLIFVTNQYGPDKVSVYGFVEPKRDSVDAG